MAESIIPNVNKSRATYPGVTLVETCSFDCYTGNADALLAVGLIRAEQLPGAPGMPKTAVTFYDGRRATRGMCVPKDEGYLNIAARGKRFEVRRGLTADAMAARLSERDAEYAATKVLDAAARAAESQARQDRWRNSIVAKTTLDLMPHSTQELSNKAIDHMRRAVDLVFSIHIRPNQYGGYWLEDVAADRLSALRDQMIKVVAEAGIVFDPARHAHIAQSCKVAIAKDDVGFQRSLGRMTSGHE